MKTHLLKQTLVYWCKIHDCWEAQANRVQATTVAVITTSLIPKVMNSYSQTAVNSISARLKNMDQNRENQIFFKLAVSVRYEFKFKGIAVLD